MQKGKKFVKINLLLRETIIEFLLFLFIFGSCSHVAKDILVILTAIISLVIRDDCMHSKLNVFTFISVLYSRS